MTEEDDPLSNAKALLDAFETIEDTGHTSRSGASSRAAPIPVAKSSQPREAPVVGLAGKTEGIMAHDGDVEAVREAPVNIGTNLVHEAPENLSYTKADERQKPLDKTIRKTDSISLPKSIPLPKKDSED